MQHLYEQKRDTNRSQILLMLEVILGEGQICISNMLRCIKVQRNKGQAQKIDLKLIIMSKAKYRAKKNPETVNDTYYGAHNCIG